ncbi:MAG: carboxymuconolactone decarboxylase family protein [Nitrospiraceae bacterium]|nr:carboxymuconolactone decarboxylase family protein [Nitrospiraceae bacterium]
MSSGGGRLADLQQGDLDQTQMRLYELITGGPRAGDQSASPIVDENGALAGPFGPMLLSPAVGEPLQELGAAIRYRSTLPPRVREAAILLVAASEGSAFEWSAHHRLATAAGLAETDIALIQAGRAPVGMTPEEDALFAAALLLVQGGAIGNAPYARLAASAGEKALFELCTLVGYYRTLALVMRLFAIA